MNTFRENTEAGGSYRLSAAIGTVRIAVAWALIGGTLDNPKQNGQERRFS